MKLVYSLLQNKMSVLTYNVELIPKSQEDFLKIEKILDANRFAWNKISKVYYGLGKNTDRKDLHKQTYFPIRREKPEIPAQVIIRAQNDVRAAYKSVVSNKHKIVKPIEKKKLSMRLDKRLYRLKEGLIFLTTLEKRCEFTFKTFEKFNELKAKYVFGDPLIFIRGGKLYAAISFKIPEIPVSSTPLAVGIDLGIKNIAATSDGKIYTDKKYLKEKRQLRFLKRKLRARKTKSARKHLKKIRRKEANRTKNFAHHLANKILDTEANVIVLEKLKGIKQKISKKRGKAFNNKFSQIPIAMLATIISYKAPLKGKTVRFVNPQNTSQIDHRTGQKDGVRKGNIYLGKDGILLHADINAAINIAKRSELPILSGNASYWQAVVNRLIVGNSLSRKV
jgi:IS605 OrfB family transposase